MESLCAACTTCSNPDCSRAGGIPMTKAKEPSEGIPLRANSDDHFYEYFNAKQREYIKKVLNDGIIEEYRRQPLGRHSEPLERTLAYFRRLPISEQYALKREQNGTFRMISMSGKRGEPPAYASETVYQTESEGYFAVFMRQIQDMMDK